MIVAAVIIWFPLYFWHKTLYILCQITWQWTILRLIRIRRLKISRHTTSNPTPMTEDNRSSVLTWQFSIATLLLILHRPTCPHYSQNLSINTSLKLQTKTNVNPIMLLPIDPWAIPNCTERPIWSHDATPKKLWGFIYIYYLYTFFYHVNHVCIGPPTCFNSFIHGWRHHDQQVRQPQGSKYLTRQIFNWDPKSPALVHTMELLVIGRLSLDGCSLVCSCLRTHHWIASGVVIGGHLVDSLAEKWFNSLIRLNQNWHMNEW